MQHLKVSVSKLSFVRLLIAGFILAVVVGITSLVASGGGSDLVARLFGSTAEAAPLGTLQGDEAIAELKQRGLYDSLADAMRAAAYGQQQLTQLDISSPAGSTVQQAYLKASNTNGDDRFGWSVAVSGDTVVIGANLEDSNATGVNGDQSNNSATLSGAAYVFTRNATTWSQQAYLKASNTAVSDQFGSAVAVSGDTIVIGATGEDSNAIGVNGDQSNNSAANSGAAYVFTRSGTTWTQQAYLKASNTGSVDQFGYSVAVSGDTIVVGAYQEDSNATGVDGAQTNNSASGSGAAYTFTRSGTTWSQQAYLKASNTDAGDQFGASVAVSGDTVVIGAHFEDSSATGVNGDQGDNSASASGAAYVFTRSGTTWSQQAYLKASNTEANDFFGSSVAVSGDTVVGGADGEDSNSTGVNGDQSNNLAEDSGAAYVFTRSGTTWNQQAYLKASNTEANDEFGSSVAVSGDTVVVGADSESSNATGVNGDQSNNLAGDSGAAYVFTRSGGVWSQQDYIKASNTGLGDIFGYSVAVSGDRVVVGAYSEDSSATGVNGDQTNNSASGSGAAYVFGDDDEPTPTPTATPTATPTPCPGDDRLRPSVPFASGGFGATLDLEGNTAIIANMQFNIDGSYGGFGDVYSFEWDGTAWNEQQRLPGPETRDLFGGAVAVEGNTLAVGAPYASGHTGQVHIFERVGGVWTEQQVLTASDATTNSNFGSVALFGNTMVVGAGSANIGSTGKAYVFTRTGGVWSEQQILSEPATSGFGSSVALDDDTIVAGSSGEQIQAGAVYVFTRSGSTWTLQQRLVASDRDQGDRFGTSVHVEGDSVLVGAWLDDISGLTFAGSAYAFERSGTTWTETQKLTAPTPQQNAFFGSTVSFTGNTGLIGTGGKGAYVLKRTGGVWTIDETLTGEPGSLFGRAVSVASSRMIVGAPKDDGTGTASIFDIDSPRARLGECATPSPTLTPTMTPTATPTASPTPGAGFENDVTPRSNGDGIVISGDVIQMRRFATGLDTASIDPNEYQRADSAPRATFGDGLISSGDVIQARRYATGLDPATPASGPTGPPTVPNLITRVLEDVYSYFFDRALTVGAIENEGKAVIVPVELVPHGNEVAVSFTLKYDASRYGSPSVFLAKGAPAGAILTVNDTQDGRLGILIDSTEAFTASAMPVRFVQVEFQPLKGDAKKAIFSLTGSVAPISISDAQGKTLYK
ncbi:MAG: hypothetical protein WBO10_11370 [Pyrinomonadaceae bacterium]